MAGKTHISSLAEQVRLYAAALISHHGFMLMKESDAVSDDSAKFGTNAKALAKQFRKKKRIKKKKIYKMPPELAASLQSSKPAITEEQLAKLAEQAKVAIEEASELLGEQAVYIAASLYPESSIGKQDEARNIEWYRIINGW